MTVFISKLIGDKRRWRQYKARVKALPEPYRSAVDAIERYLMSFGRGDGTGWAEQLEDLGPALGEGDVERGSRGEPRGGTPDGAVGVAHDRVAAGEHACGIEVREGRAAGVQARQAQPERIRRGLPQAPGECAAASRHGWGSLAGAPAVARL